MRYLLTTIFLLIYTISSMSSVINIETQYKEFVQRVEDDKVQEHRNNIILAIIQKESNGIDTIVGDMVGVLQIRPIMVREVNNILGYIKYTLNDRMCRIKSIEMFNIYTNHHTPDWNLELVARRWNGGYNGENKTATINYYKQVKLIMNML